MATHSRTPAWAIPWTKEPGGLQSIRSQKSDATVAAELIHKHGSNIVLPEGITISFRLENFSLLIWEKKSRCQGKRVWNSPAMASKSTSVNGNEVSKGGMRVSVELTHLACSREQDASVKPAGQRQAQSRAPLWDPWCIALLAPLSWKSGKSPELGCRFLLQGILLTQGWNPSLCVSCFGRHVPYQLSHWGSPKQVFSN